MITYKLLQTSGRDVLLRSLATCILLTVVSILTFAASHKVVVTTEKEENPLEKISGNMNLAGGVYYNSPFDQAEDSDTPAGYEIFYVSTYARHGMRYFDDKMTLALLKDVFDFGSRHNILTPLGESLYQRFRILYPYMENRNGELTQGGMQQWKDAAHRLAKKHPALFDENARIYSESTNVMRTAMSMANFNMELQTIFPNLNLTFDVSSQFHAWLNPFAADAPHHIRLDESFRGRDGEWYPVWREFAFSKIDNDSFISRIFRNVDLIEKNFDTLEFEYAFWLLAQAAPNLDKKTDFSDAFTRYEIIGWWEIDNYKFYLQKGKNTFNLGRPQQLSAYILENIIDRARKVINNNQHGLHMRFGHDGCIMAMLSMMDADTWGESSEDPEEVKGFWQTYNIPMASVCSFNFYRNKSTDEILIKPLLNGKALTLPLEAVTEKCYRWNDFDKYYSSKINECKEKLAVNIGEK